MEHNSELVSCVAIAFLLSESAAEEEEGEQGGVAARSMEEGKSYSLWFYQTN